MILLLEILPLLSFCGGRAGSTDPGIVARNSFPAINMSIERYLICRPPTQLCFQIYLMFGKIP